VTIFNGVLSIIFFLALAAGSIWIAHDLWHAHEGSDLLGIPYAPLRIASIIALISVAALFARGLRRNTRP
jgi:TRAP-type C4-dicarboxylate transport system permease small subunit